MESYDLPALLKMVVECDASDLFLTTGAPPHVKVDGIVQALPLPALAGGPNQAPGLFGHGSCSGCRI
jgi:Tfp pilus assembly ATPase PilU